MRSCAGRLAAAAVLAAAASVSRADNVFTYYSFDGIAQYDMARCLDGSHTGVAVQAGVGADADKWLVWFEGGGWCYSLADCQHRALGGCAPGGACGSSRGGRAGDGQGQGFIAGGLMNNNASMNPSLATWSKVWLPYCDGASFSGRNAGTVRFDNGNGTVSDLYFRGAYNLEATLDWLMTNATTNFSRAETVVLTGCSAGGLAAYLHADEVAQRVPPTADFRVAPGSGFFSNAVNAYGEPVYSDQMRGVFYLHNASAGVNQHCVQAQAAGYEWVCMMAYASYEYTQSRIFPLQSHTDWWQSGCVFTAGPIPANSTENGLCFQGAVAGCAWSLEACTQEQAQLTLQWASRNRDDIVLSPTAQRPGNGGFVNSCHSHCQESSDVWSSIEVGGVPLWRAFDAWLASASTDAPMWTVDALNHVAKPPGSPPASCRNVNPSCRPPPANQSECGW